MTIIDFLSLGILFVISYIISLCIAYATHCINEEIEYRKWRKENETN